MPETMQELVSKELVLTEREFRQISELAHQRFGLELKPGKEALVSSRLGKRLRQRGFHSFADYYRHILSDSTGEALVELIDSLTTNHTSFLRERSHFEFLARAVAGEFGAGDLDIWSAACSSGEEPYSIAMCVSDAGSRADASSKAGFQRRAVRIFATDISTRVLAIARAGIYPAERFREMPEAWRRAYLLKGVKESEGRFKVKPELARLVEFQGINLIQPFTHKRLFQVIFCRNVMMYFDKATQQDIVQRLSQCLLPGGYLFVGHSESLTGVKHDLGYVCPAIYRKGAAGLKAPK
jgi:chemotaxis protein methyltransferase CheR